MQIILEDVTKVYDNGARALANLDLEIKDGELLAVLGPSGCGKTTTLRLIAGLEQPTEGTIRMGGRVVNSVPPRLRNVGMVFQRPALNPQRTVRGNLQFGWELRHPWGRFRRLLRLFSSERDDNLQKRTIEETARNLGLENELSHYPHELSGGQEQRVALGRILVRRPEVILLDEPLGHLDCPLRLDLRRQLHLLHRSIPATMVYVTHDPAEVLALGDRVAVLDQGTVQQVGSPESLFRKPANRQVARLLCPGLNLLDGELRGENDVAFSVAGLNIPLPTSWSPFRSRPVTVGIRPEDIEISERKLAAGVLLMEVDLIESLGEGYLTTCTGQGLTLSGLCGTRFVRGQHVMLTIAWQNALLFDRLSGRTLGLESG